MNRSRRWLVIWAIASVLWIGFLILRSWADIAPAFSEIKITHVEVPTEIVDRTAGSLHQDMSPPGGKPSRETFDFPKYLNVPADRKLSPDEALFKEARQMFPSFEGKSDQVLVDHVWQAAQRSAGQLADRQRDRAEGALIVAVLRSVLLPLVVLLASSVTVWLLHKFLPPPYARKVIAVSVIWVMASIAWSAIQEDSLRYALADRYTLQHFLPPIVVVLAAVIWAWASRTPKDG
jgi:hypothetical protein